MSILGKLQFWKKEDSFSEPPAYDLGAQHYDPLQQPDPMQNPFPQQSFSQDPFANSQSTDDSMQSPGLHSTGQYPTQQAQFPGRSPQFQAPTQYQEQDPAPGVHPRDVELILAKLDAIKSELDALHQRVRKIEQSSDTGQTPQKKYW